MLEDHFCFYSLCGSLLLLSHYCQYSNGLAEVFKMFFNMLNMGDYVCTALHMSDR